MCGLVWCAPPCMGSINGVHRVCLLCVLYLGCIWCECVVWFCVWGLHCCGMVCVWGVLPVCGVSRWYVLFFVWGVSGVCVPPCVLLLCRRPPVCGVSVVYVVCSGVCVLCASCLCIMSCFSVQVPLSAWVCSISSQILHGGHVPGLRLEARLPTVWRGEPGIQGSTVGAALRKVSDPGR